MGQAGAPHDQLTPICTLTSKGKLSLRGGMNAVDILKTTQSAFKGYRRDRYTSLVEVDDRLMGTSMEVSWLYSSDFARSNPAFERITDAIETKLVEVFGGPADKGILSLSVQETAYDMGRAVLRSHAYLESISMYTPNLHNLPFPLANHGLENVDHTGHPNIFYPIDEPHGMIKTTVTRKHLAARL